MSKELDIDLKKNPKPTVEIEGYKYVVKGFFDPQYIDGDPNRCVPSLMDIDETPIAPIDFTLKSHQDTINPDKTDACDVIFLNRKGVDKWLAWPVHTYSIVLQPKQINNPEYDEYKDRFSTLAGITYKTIGDWTDFLKSVSEAGKTASETPEQRLWVGLDKEAKERIAVLVAQDDVDRRELYGFSRDRDKKDKININLLDKLQVSLARRDFIPETVMADLKKEAKTKKDITDFNNLIMRDISTLKDYEVLNMNSYWMENGVKNFKAGTPSAKYNPENGDTQVKGSFKRKCPLNYPMLMQSGKNTLKPALNIWKTRER